MAEGTILDVVGGRLVLRGASGTRRGAFIVERGGTPDRWGRDFFLVADHMDPYELDGWPRTEEAAAFLERRKALLTLQDAHDAEIKYSQDLFPYQRVGVKFLVTAEKAVLNFEPRMGKTATSIRAAEEVGARRVLIVTKLRLTDQWAREILRWRVRDGEAPTVFTARHNAVPEGRWVITNYETAWRREELLADAGFDVMILDESTKAKNRKTHVANAMIRLAQGIRYVWLLTGTPIHNWPDELWVQLRIIDPRHFSNNATSYWKFVERYCDVRLTPWGKKVVGVREEYLPELRKRLVYRLLRRERALVGLSPKSYETVVLKMPPIQELAYRQMESVSVAIIETAGGPYAVPAPTALAQLTRLRQIACSPLLVAYSVNLPQGGTRPLAEVMDAKARYLKDLLEDVGEMQKVLVFTTFARYAELLYHDLRKRSRRTYDYGPVLVTGETPPEEARAAIRRFREDRSCRVFITTIQSCGEGLTLPEADIVVFMDRWWVPKINEQAEDRAVGHKDRTVHVIYLVCEGTVDEYIEEICRDKAKAADEVLLRGVLTKMLEKKGGEFVETKGSSENL